MLDLKPANEIRVRKQRKLRNYETKHEIWLYLILGGNGPPCPSLWKHLSWMREQWLNENGGEGVWVA